MISASSAASGVSSESMKLFILSAAETLAFSADRFDLEVRNFIAGFPGNQGAFDRAMQKSEAVHEHVYNDTHSHLGNQDRAAEFFDGAALWRAMKSPPLAQSGCVGCHTARAHFASTGSPCLRYPWP